MTGGRAASDSLTQGIVNMGTIIGPLVELADGFGRVFTAAFRVGVIAVESLSIVLNKLFQGIIAGVDLVYRALALAMPEAFGEASKSVTKFVSDFAKGTDDLTNKTISDFDKLTNTFGETTTLEKFAARSKQAAIAIQEAIAAQSAKPQVQDQAGGAVDNGMSPAALKEIQDEKTKLAEINKIYSDSQLERETADLQFKIATGEQRVSDLIELQSFEQQKIQIALDAELEKANNLETPRKIQLAKAKAYADADLAQSKLASKSKIDIRKQELSDQEAFFSAASSLSSAKNAELAAIGKAAAITQIAIKTPPAIASSFEFGTKLGGPVLGFALGAIAATAMGAQAANIAGVKFEQGGIVPGLNQFGDNVNVRVNPGEVILNNTQQQELLNIANGRAGNRNDGMLAALVDAIRNQVISVQIEGREIARTIRDQRASGYAV